MKNLMLAMLLTLAVCGVTFGAEQITAEEAFVIASQSTDDPIVGIWRMHPINGGRRKIAHMAIVPNNAKNRQNWDYLGIMLEDGFQIKKNGIKIALSQTDSAYTYYVILSNRVSGPGVIYVDGSGFAHLKGILLDMSRVEVPPIETISFNFDIFRYAPITHMIKVRDFQMGTGNQEFKPSGLSFDGLNIEAVEPGSLADKAGLRPGDAIVEINGRAADDEVIEDIETRLRAGRSVIIIYERGRSKDMATLKWSLGTQ